MSECVLGLARFIRGCFFTDILRIDHLWEFTSLVRLDLTNNLIEKIEGLDCLVNLTSLSKAKLCIHMLLTLSSQNCVGVGKDIENALKYQQMINNNDNNLNVFFRSVIQQHRKH